MGAVLRFGVTLLVCLVFFNGPAAAGAPSVPAFGSYFPSWLLSLFLGVITTVILRVVFVLVGVDDILRWRVVSYMALALALSFVFSMLIFGR